MFGFPEELSVMDSGLRELYCGASLFKKKGTKNHRRRNRRKLTWEDKFALLQEFKRLFGHCEVPLGYNVHGVKLGGWVDTQRKEFWKHRLGI